MGKPSPVPEIIVIISVSLFLLCRRLLLIKIFDIIIHGNSVGKIVLNHSIIPFFDALIQRVGFKTKAPVTNKNNNTTNK